MTSHQVTKRWWLLSSLTFVHSGLLALSKQAVVSCPVERPMRQGTESDLWPAAWEELNPINNHMSKLGSGAFLS